MSVITKCFDGIDKISAGDFTDDELKDILRNLDKARGEELEGISKVSAEKLQGAIGNMQSAATRIMDEITKKEMLKKVELARKVNILSHAARVIDEGIRSGFTPETMIVSMMDGTEHKTIKGTRYNLNTHAKTEEIKAVSDIFFRIRKIGGNAMKIWNKGNHDVDIVKAWAGKLVGVKEIDELGVMVREFQEKSIARTLQNGLPVETSPAYYEHVVWDKKQLLKTHDSWWDRRMFDKSLIGNPNRDQIKFDKAFERYFEFNENEYANKDETYGQNASLEDRRKWQYEAFQRLTDQKNTLDGSDNLYKSMTYARKIIPQDEAAYIKQVRKYGLGSLKSTFEASMRKNAINNVVLEHLGNSPKAMIKSIVKMAYDRARAAGKTFQRVGIEKVEKAAQDSLKATTHTIYDDNNTAASIEKAIRKYEMVEHLANTVRVGVLNDTIQVALQSERSMPGYNKFLRALGNTYKEMIKGIVAKKDQLDLAETLGIHKKSQSYMMSQFVGYDENNRISFLDKLLKVSAGASLNEGAGFGKEFSIGATLARSLGHYRNLPLEELPSILRQDMEYSGIDSNLWETMRTRASKIVGGEHVIAGDITENLDDNAIREYLKRTGVDATNYTSFALDRIRQNLAARVRTFFNDQIEHGVLKEGSRDAVKWTAGVDAKKPAGQWLAALLRALHFFKSYETAMVSKLFARMIYGPVEDTYFNKILGGKAAYNYMAKFAAGALSMGAISTGLQMRMGRKIETPLEFMGATIENSGALGLFTALLPSNMTTVEKAFRAIAGPELGLIADTGMFVAKALSGHEDKYGGFTSNLTAKSTYFFIKNHLPFINTIYLKKILNYLVFDALQQSITDSGSHYT